MVCFLAASHIQQVHLCGLHFIALSKECLRNLCIRIIRCLHIGGLSLACLWNVGGSHCLPFIALSVAGLCNFRESSCLHIGGLSLARLWNVGGSHCLPFIALSV